MEPTDNLAETDETAVDHSVLPSRPRVVVNVLGTVYVHGEERLEETFRSRSRELLVYLAARGGQAPQYAMLEDLLPDAPRSKASDRLNTNVYGLRNVLSFLGGEADYLQHPRGKYVLNRELVDIDLWRVQAAIDDAAKATDRETRIAAWKRAIDTYTGPLADDRDYGWLGPYQHAALRQILDVHLALAEALTEQTPAEALQVLHHALKLDPCAEPVYRQAIDVHASRGDAIRMLRRDLERHSAELDAEPTEETLAHADRLIAGLRRQPSRRNNRQRER